MTPRNLLVLVAVVIVSLACHAQAPRNRYLRTLTQSMEIVGDMYVEDVETRQLFEDAMQGMMSGLDPYSSFISAKSFQQFQESLDQEFGGIGIVVEGPPRTERLTVVSPIVNTPAYDAGLRPGDVILEIDGVSTEGMRLEEAVTLMRGPRGSEVRLVVQHADQEEPARYRIRRDTIPIESVLGDRRLPDGSWSYTLEDNPRIGYIRVTSFGEHTARDLAAALDSIDPLDGLILDLRGNAGGLLTAAIETCDMFIEQGDIVSTRGRGGVVRQKYEATPDLRIPRDIPMAVLTNGGSASASEIVAACLKDHDRAVVVGERTWGKGTVQNIIELEGGRSALKLTTSSYWRPNGHNIHRREEATEEDEWGVRPSEGFEVKLTEDQARRALEARRQRDVVPGKGAPPSPPAPTQPNNPRSETEAPETEAPETEAPETETPETEAPETENGETENGETENGETENGETENGEKETGETAAFDSDDPGADKSSDGEDPQLRRAIDYIEGLLDSPHEAKA